MMSKEERKQYNAEYYENNKEKAREYSGKKIQCKCGSQIVRASYSRHLRSALHTNRLKQIARDELIIELEKKKLKKQK